MDGITQAMMNLIESEVCGAKFNPELYAALSGEEKVELYRLSKKHDLAHIVGNALLNADLLSEGKLKEAYQKEVYTAVFRYETIAYELEELRRVFNEAKIPFIPLKGSVIRKYYPEPWMRTSCDIDILVKESDAEEASKTLSERLQYVVHEKGQHDISLFSPFGIHVELHFKLMDLDFKQVQALNDIWSGGEIVSVSDYEYRMSNELFLLYIEKSGERIIYSKGLPQYFISDIMDEDILCAYGVDDRKLLLFDNFRCWDEGCYMGRVK